MGLSLNPERLMQRISNNDPYADDAGWRWSQRYWQPCWRAYLSPE
ncbi:MAG TPA: hypothetical protein PKY10_03315 [Lentisphaeria bacterium]|nr:hypothetical protein [Lentisphaeria bacterium]